MHPQSESRVGSCPSIARKKYIICWSPLPKWYERGTNQTKANSCFVCFQKSKDTSLTSLASVPNGRLCSVTRNARVLIGYVRKPPWKGGTLRRLDPSSARLLTSLSPSRYVTFETAVSSVCPGRSGRDSCCAWSVNRRHCERSLGLALAWHKRLARGGGCVVNPGRAARKPAACRVPTRARRRS